MASPPCFQSPPGPQEPAGRLPRLCAVRRMDGSWAERSTTPLHLEPEWTAAPLLWAHHGDDDAKSGCVLGPLCADSRGPGSRWSWSPVSLAPTAALPARSAPARAAPCSLPLGLASCSSYGGGDPEVHLQPTRHRVPVLSRTGCHAGRLPASAAGSARPRGGSRMKCDGGLRCRTLL